MKVNLIIALILSTILAGAQTKSPDKIKVRKAADTSAQIPVIENEPIAFVQTPAEYLGGMPAMLKFISTTMVLPPEANEPMCFTIYVNFTISKDGEVTDPKILKGATGCPKCDEEALRVVKLMPKWKPGMDNGKPVATLFNIPIRIKTR